MRNANSQLPRSMILVRALHQPPGPHVSHAETEGENFEPARLRSFGAAPASRFVAARRAEALAKAGAEIGG